MRTLDAFYGKGIDYSNLHEMRRDVKSLYRHNGVRKILSMKPSWEKHSPYVIIGNKIVLMLADWKAMRITAIREVAWKTGEYMEGTMDLNAATWVAEEFAERIGLIDHNGRTATPPAATLRLEYIKLKLADGRTIELDDMETEDWRFRGVKAFLEAVQ